MSNKLVSYVVWGAVAVLGALGFAMLSLANGEKKFRQRG